MTVVSSGMIQCSHCERSDTVKQAFTTNLYRRDTMDAQMSGRPRCKHRTQILFALTCLYDYILLYRLYKERHGIQDSF